MKKFLAFLLSAAFALTMFTGCFGGEDDEDDAALLSEIAGYPNYAIVANTPIEGVESFALVGADGTNASISGDSVVSATEGYLDYAATISETANRGKIWLNGTLVDASGSGGSFSGVITLSSGNNYITFIIYEEGVAVGRSPLVKITCATEASEFRFELIWDGVADMDLHLASEDFDTSSSTDYDATWHVYFGNKTYDEGEYNIELDVDNTDAYGPENIRIFSIPTGATFKCFVHYWSGSITINPTINVYVGANSIPEYTFYVEGGMVDEDIALVGGDDGLWEITEGKAAPKGAAKVTKAKSLGQKEAKVKK